MMHEQTLRDFHDTLQHTQWAPPDELRAYQRRQLEHMLRHAARTVPFYKDRLAPIFRSDGSVDFGRWHEVPITTRSDMHEHQSDMQSMAVPESHGHVAPYTTSGSTGTPVQVNWTLLGSLARRAALWRMYQWHSFDFSKTLAATTGQAPWPEGAMKGPWGPPWMAQSRGARLTISTMTSIPRLTEWLHRKKVGYLSGLGMFLPAIAEEAARQGLKLDLAGMVSVGIQVRDADREKVKELLEIPIVEVYSSQECGHMAHQCAAGSLHVLSELVYLEILDDENRPCPPGVAGRVVATGLCNSAQPAIRYEQGDISAFAPPCPCGSTLPVLAPISGRQRHMFQFSGGQRFTVLDSVVYKILKPLLDPSWYQIAQTGSQSIEIRFVSKIPLSDDLKAAIVSAMPRVLHRSDIAVSFKPFESSPVRPGQKHHLFVNEHANGVRPA